MANEKRLIDANILKTLFDVRYDTACIQERTRENKDQWNGYCTGINWGRNTIANAPTVDAVEVVHGRWEVIEASDELYKCSACGEWQYIPEEHFAYCPYCGAKMDGGNEDAL